ncbi:unnamed protein product [Rhizophagus irregularis]|nr:unnamed protein product [Rhizophagus irregularis]CAB4423713.1 unnamed protein product [Rhizophagus irregularis]
MTLFINWFFDGYVSKSEVDDYSSKLVDCGIASLKSDEDKKFWQVKEPLAIEVVKLSFFPDDVDVIESLLYESRFSKYMLVPGHLVRPDGIYISKLNINTYWTLLISVKMYTSKLSGKDVDDDKNSTDWSLLYHKKNGEVTCKNLKQRLDELSCFLPIRYSEWMITD